MVCLFCSLSLLASLFPELITCAVLCCADVGVHAAGGRQARDCFFLLAFSHTEVQRPP